MGVLLTTKPGKAGTNTCVFAILSLENDFNLILNTQKVKNLLLLMKKEVVFTTNHQIMR